MPFTKPENITGKKSGYEGHVVRVVVVKMVSFKFETAMKQLGKAQTVGNREWL